MSSRWKKVWADFWGNKTRTFLMIERRREIGVMRAVGASSKDVGFVFTGH